MKGVRHNSTSDLFWKLWPTDINDDVDKFNKAINEMNKEKKDNYQKVTKPITKSEFMIFIALLIEASVHRLQGNKFWSYRRGNERRGLYEKVDFSKYMMLWRFLEIKRVIPSILVDEDLRKDGDVWWRFNSRMSLIK